MTDATQLFLYRREQALSTLSEAQRMLQEGFSVRSVVNRAYYAMFYMVLALFLKKGIAVNTSKHSGVMSLFDKEFIHTGLVDPSCSKALHKAFDRRLEFDYKDFIEPSTLDAQQTVDAAASFITCLDLLANA